MRTAHASVSIQGAKIQGAKIQGTKLQQPGSDGAWLRGPQFIPLCTSSARSAGEALFKFLRCGNVCLFDGPSSSPDWGIASSIWPSRVSARQCPSAPVLDTRPQRFP